MIVEQNLESTLTEAVKQVVHEKPTNAARRLGELLTEKSVTSLTPYSLSHASSHASPRASPHASPATAPAQLSRH